MPLVFDATPNINVPADIAKKNINLDILPKIENDLDIDDIVSILFLMVDSYTDAFLKVFRLYCKAKKDGTSVIAELIKTHTQDWENRLLESICVCNNRQVVKKLGLSFKDLENKYFPKSRSCTVCLHPIAKCLYLLCDSLNNEETQKLVKLVKEDLIKYNPMLEDIEHLELHLLYWMEIGYISIISDRKGNFMNLLKHLKTFKDLELIILDLEKYNTDQGASNVSTSKEASSSIYKTNLTEIDARDANKNIRKINKGLCIIINQMYFQGSEYETRIGTITDASELNNTFKEFGFEVDISHDLEGNEVIRKIQNISQQYGSNYDCIFLFILSHGYEGGIIATDSAEISLKSIETAFCCKEFQDVLKIVIIQACQGKVAGKAPIHDALTTDGLDGHVSVTPDITVRRNFCIFMSTLEGFVSMRDKRQGSWFIQELCNILRQKERRMTFLECVTEVIKAVQNKRGIMDGECVAQLPELRTCRLDTDFELPRYKS